MVKWLSGSDRIYGWWISGSDRICGGGVLVDCDYYKLAMRILLPDPHCSDRYGCGFCGGIWGFGDYYFFG